jgi:hypothetical protein
VWEQLLCLWKQFHIFCSPQERKNDFVNTSGSVFRKRFDRVINTPASYSGDSGFKSRPGDWLSWLGYSYFSSVPRGKYRDITLNKNMTASFDILSNSAFIYHPFIRFYIVWVAEKRCGINCYKLMWY